MNTFCKHIHPKRRATSLCFVNGQDSDTVRHQDCYFGQGPLLPPGCLPCTCSQRVGGWGEGGGSNQENNINVYLTTYGSFQVISTKVFT